MTSKKKGLWDENNLKTSLQKNSDWFSQKKISLKEAFSRYGIARNTLFDKVKRIKSGQEITLQSKLGRFTFSLQNMKN